MITWIQYWNLVIAISMWCVGFYTITRKGKVFHFISDWFERTREIKNNPNLEGQGYIIPAYIANPIVSCIYCMASFHGIWIYAAYLFFSGAEISLPNILMVAPICVSASPLNGIIWGLVKKLSEGKIHD